MIVFIVSIAFLFFISIKNSKDESLAVAHMSASLEDDAGTSGVPQVMFFSSYGTFG